METIENIKRWLEQSSDEDVFEAIQYVQGLDIVAGQLKLNGRNISRERAAELLFDEGCFHPFTHEDSYDILNSNPDGPDSTVYGSVCDVCDEWVDQEDDPDWAYEQYRDDQLMEGRA